MAQEKQKIDALTGLRFFVAFWVLLLHISGDRLKALLPEPLINITLQGFAGVSFFFILSGFVLAINYEKAFPNSEGIKANFKRFFTARIARIYPLYLAAFLPLLAIEVFEATSGRSGLGYIPVQWGLSFAALQTWAPGFLNFPNTPAWSISCEFFFYALFPIFTIFFTRQSTAKNSRTLWVLLGVSLFAGILLPAIYFFAVGPGQTLVATSTDYFFKFGPLVRLPEFVTGLIAGILFNRGHLPRFITQRGGLLASVTTIGLLVALAFNPLPYIFAHSGSLALPFLVIILALSQGGGALGKFLSHPVCIYLGEISYSLYITHVVVISTGQRILEYIWAESPPNWADLTIYLFIPIVAMIGYHLVEKPGRTVILSAVKKRTEANISTPTPATNHPFLK